MLESEIAHFNSCELIPQHSKHSQTRRLMESSEEEESDKDDLDDEPPRKRANYGQVLSSS